MKKIIVGLLLLSFCFAANANIRIGNLDNSNTAGAKIYSGYEFKTMVVTDQSAPTSSALVWYADNFLGYSVMGISGFEVTSGNLPTTISAQAIKPDGTNVSVDAQILTVGTDITEFHSPWYKFTLPADSVTRDISFIFNIAD